MPNQSILLKINPQLGLLNDIFQDTSNVFRDSKLSNYIQIAVADIFRNAKDKSLFSLDIETLSDTDELRYELASNRFNFLRPLKINGINHALDISEDFGGVAHFLADKVNTLDSIKIDSDRTRLSTIRCANKHNVCHISEDLDKLKLPNKHYDLIVLGELGALQLTKENQAKLLSRLQASLSDRGVLVVNTSNRTRIAKWLDPNSENSAIAYQDLYFTNSEQEYDRKELLDIIAAANYASIDFYGTFSKGNRFQNLFSEDYLTSNLNALNHFYRIGAVDNADINEHLLFKNLSRDKQRIFDFASRFVVIAGANSASTKRIYNNDFAHFAGTGRKAKWRTITERSRSNSEVTKTLLYPDVTDHGSAFSKPQISQNLSSQPYQNGHLLIESWLQAVLDNDTHKFSSLVLEYSDWLNGLSSEDDFTKYAYDLLPFNIVVGKGDGAQAYQLIDTEWQVDGEFTADYVLFRALFWFAFENKALLQSFAERVDLPSIAIFIVNYMPNIGQTSELQKFIELEEHIQSQIDNNFRSKAVEYALLQSFDSTPTINDDQPKCQILWGNSKGQVDEEHSIYIEWLNSDKAQTISSRIPTFNSNAPVLRVDPIASKGFFKISSVKIIGKESKTLLKLDSQAKVSEFAELVNIEESTTDQNNTVYVSLNTDPHLLFDLSKVKNIKTVTSIEIELSLVHDSNYDVALSTLTSTVNQQNVSLVTQTNSLNQYRAELEYTNLRLEDVIEHRTDLNSMLQKEIRDRKIQVRDLNRRLSHLNDQLVDQLHRNHEMEGFLMMRPTTRAKRFAARILGRITGKEPVAVIEEELIEETKEINLDPNVVPSSGELIGQNTEDYQLWISENNLTQSEIDSAKKEITKFKLKPTFSILVPIYNTDPEYLIPMIRSVQAQIYPHWQLCLVDDASPKSYLRKILEHEADQDERITIQLNDRNQGISLTTNDALELATGDYIALLDHDDELSNDALFENAKAINQHPEVGLIYSDEDKMDMQGNRLEPFFKPDYSPDLLDTNNYICHFTVIKKDIIDEIDGFREGLDGSQDHDVILRSIEKSERVIHIPRILYHWRKIPGSTAVVYDSKSYAWEAGRKAVENRLKKTERGVKVEFGALKGTYRVFREIHGDPLVSIVIPFKDQPGLLDACLNSILNRTTYQNFEIVGVSNNSEDDITFERMEHFKQLDPRVRFVEKNIPFNFSEVCNYGAEQSKGDYLLFLNNDIEILAPDWIDRLLEHAQRKEIGAVGGKLIYPDGRIQHAGVVAGMVGAAGHPHKFFPGNHIGYHGRLHMVFNCAAVTGAMMMISAEKFKQVGGLDQDNLAIAYNDIDLCLKLLDAGYLNVFTPHCTAIHHESISRGYEDTDEKIQRFNTEQAHFLNTWKDFLAKGDPYYNQNLSLKNERFSFNFRD